MIRGVLIVLVVAIAVFVVAVDLANDRHEQAWSFTAGLAWGAALGRLIFAKRHGLLSAEGEPAR